MLASPCRPACLTFSIQSVSKQPAPSCSWVVSAASLLMSTRGLDWSCTDLDHSANPQTHRLSNCFPDNITVAIRVQAAQMQTPDPTFGMRRPEQQQQQQQPEPPNQGNEFARMLQRANMPPQQQQQQPSHQQRLPQHLPQSPAISQTDQAVPKPQPSPKVQESAVEAHPPRPAVTQSAQEQEAVSARKHRPAAPRKAAPGPPSPPAPAPAPSSTPAWAMPEQHQPSLAGVQLEQQLQQQQQVHDWVVPPEAPASPKKAEPKAPWGAAKPPGPGRVLLSLSCSNLCYIDNLSCPVQPGLLPQSSPSALLKRLSYNMSGLICSFLTWCSFAARLTSKLTR